MESKQIIVNNVRVKWAKVFRPDEQFPPAKWSIDIYPNAEGMKVLTEEAVRLHPKGLHVKGDGPEQFVTLKKNVSRNDGQKNDPPRVVDMDGKPFDQLIGNGSVCNVICTLFRYDKYGGGVTALLDAVQVVNHVPFQEREAVDFDTAGAAGEPNDLPF